jgi:hypothetical protein
MVANIFLAMRKPADQNAGIPPFQVMKEQPALPQQ